MGDGMMSSLRSVLMWPVQEVSGWARNVRSLIDDLSWRDLFPPALIETARWVWGQLIYAAGFGTAHQQLSASFALGVASIFSTAITLGATIGLVILFALLFGIGALRLWPTFDRLWPLGSNENGAM